VLTNVNRFNLPQRTAVHFQKTLPYQRNFIPRMNTLEYIYGYAADKYRSSLLGGAVHNGCDILIYRDCASKINFCYLVQIHQIRILSGIHSFDAWKRTPILTNDQELQILDTQDCVAGPAGADDEVVDAADDDDVTSVGGGSDQVNDGLP
jgi:hypothetical protein